MAETLELFPISRDPKDMKIPYPIANQDFLLGHDCCEGMKPWLDTATLKVEVEENGQSLIFRRTGGIWNSIGALK